MEEESRQDSQIVVVQKEDTNDLPKEYLQLRVCPAPLLFLLHFQIVHKVRLRRMFRCSDFVHPPKYMYQMLLVSGLKKTLRPGRQWD